MRWDFDFNCGGKAQWREQTLTSLKDIEGRRLAKAGARP